MLARNTPQDRLREQTLTQAVVYRPEDDFTFACFGKNYKDKTGVNWSFSPLQKAEDAAKNPELCVRLASVFRALGALCIYAPSPAKSNAEYVPTRLLTHRIPLAKNITLFRNKDESGDVAMLEPGEAGAFSAGGCPLILAKKGDEFAFAHAGRDCLIDRRRINGTGLQACRLNESVVDTVMRTLGATRDSENIRVWVYGSLHPSRYPHPLSGAHADFNKAMCAYVKKEWGESGARSMPVRDGAIYLDLPLLIRAQFEYYGVPPAHIDLQHAYLIGDNAWLDGAKDAPRNLFVVMRHHY